MFQLLRKFYQFGKWYYSDANLGGGWLVDDCELTDAPAWEVDLWEFENISELLETQADLQNKGCYAVNSRGLDLLIYSKN